MFCRNCGAKLESDDQLFCRNCGARQDGAQGVQGTQMKAEKPKKKAGKIIAIVAVCLVLVAGLGCGAVWMMKYNSAEARTARLIAEGDQFFSDKDYDEAIEKYEAALDITPDSEDAYKGLYKAYKKLDDPEMIIEILEEAADATDSKYFEDKLEEARLEYYKPEVVDVPAVTPAVPDVVIPDLVDVVGVVPDNGPLTLDNAGDITLNMWCIATEADSSRHAYEMAIREMYAMYPNVTLNWEAFENQAYKTKIKAAVSANEIPDIFFTWSGAFLQDFVDTGKVYCLDELYPDYANDLPESMLGNSTFNGHHYGVPLTMNMVALYVNMDLLRSVGYDDFPLTYNEFIQCCEALRSADIIPFGCAGRETWCVTEYLEPVMLKCTGVDMLNNIFLGRVTWDNDRLEAAVDVFQAMIASGYFDPDGLYLSNDEVKANFIDGKYAFYMNGTWNCADFAWNSYYDIVIEEFPIIDSRYGENRTYIGGPSDTLAVSASSAYPELAAQYAFELGRLISYYGYMDGYGLPCWRFYGDESNINPLTREAAEMGIDADGFVLFGDTVMIADDAWIYLDDVSLIYSGQINGQEFIEDLAYNIR